MKTESQKPRCYHEDISSGLRPAFEVQPGGWAGKDSLNFGYSNIPQQQELTQISFKTIHDEIIPYALEQWSDVIQMDFHEVSDVNNANVIFSFADSNHFKWNPGGEVARTVVVGGQEKTQTWIKKDMIWLDDINAPTAFATGINLRAIVCHEVGHILFLAHSLDPEALMFKDVTNDRINLRPDDINGITSKYPKRTG